MIITMKHVRQAGMCSSGARAFFKRYNLDWPSFLQNGLDENVLLATGDSLAAQVVEVAHNG